MEFANFCWPIVLPTVVGLGQIRSLIQLSFSWSLLYSLCDEFFIHSTTVSYLSLLWCQSPILLIYKFIISFQKYVYQHFIKFTKTIWPRATWSSNSFFQVHCSGSFVLQVTVQLYLKPIVFNAHTQQHQVMSHIKMSTFFVQDGCCVSNIHYVLEPAGIEF